MKHLGGGVGGSKKDNFSATLLSSPFRVASMVLVPWELILFLGMSVEFKGKIMSQYSRGVK